MVEIALFMAPAFILCLILVGICGYVGLHVLMREVIFIDIALAQIAALGASLSLFFNFELNAPLTYIISLSATLIAAILLSGVRYFSSKVPQEAFIGILYATGAAAILMMGDRLAHGSEHVHDLMCGHLLWVSWGEVGLFILIFVGLGTIFAFIHQRLLKISMSKKASDLSGMKIGYWDFIFYALLGILVTFAVRVAGVLLVFGFLIVPASIGSLLGKSFISRLLLAWTTGVAVSLIGCILSYRLDFPTGAMVVVTLGLCLFLIAIIKLSIIRKIAR